MCTKRDVGYSVMGKGGGGGGVALECVPLPGCVLELIAFTKRDVGYGIGGRGWRKGVYLHQEVF